MSEKLCSCYTVHSPMKTSFIRKKGSNKVNIETLMITSCVVYSCTKCGRSWEEACN